MTKSLRLAAFLMMAATSTAAIAQSHDDKAEARGSKQVVLVTQDFVRGHAAMSTCMDASSSFHRAGRPLSFKWDFGDGRGAATTASACHEYRDPGLYAARITVKDDTGVTESRTVIVSVAPMKSPGV